MGRIGRDDGQKDEEGNRRGTGVKANLLVMLVE